MGGKRKGRALGKLHLLTSVGRAGSHPTAGPDPGELPGGCQWAELGTTRPQVRTLGSSPVDVSGQSWEPADRRSGPWRAPEWLSVGRAGLQLDCIRTLESSRMQATRLLCVEGAGEAGNGSVG